MRILFSVAVIAVIIWKYDELKNIDVAAIIASSGNTAKAIAAILGVYAVKSVTFVVPASLIYLAVGIAFKPALAVAVNVAGILIEICITYIIGLLLGGKYVVSKVETTKYGEKLLKMQSKNKVSALIAIRFLPVFPIDIVSLLLGAVKTPFLQYIAVSLIGILPRVIVLTVLGVAISDLIPTQLMIKIGLIAIPVALAVWIIRYAVKSAKKAKEKEEN